MYSVVLMAALTAGTAEPSWFFCRHYSTCHSCYGCSGCSGCSGCYGCSGCSGCYGCYSSCQGCYGGVSYSSCGCYGYSSCYGCYGCQGCYGTVHYEPVQAAPAQPSAAPKSAEPVPAPKKEEPKKEVSAGDQAKLVVLDLPEDAKLYIDDQLMKTGTARRSFRTPHLDKGQTYYYILRVEVNRDGKTLSKTKRVILQAGEEAQASFVELQPVKGDATAKVER